jgi:hypothetical protein
MRKGLLLLASTSVLLVSSGFASDSTKKITTEEWEIINSIRDSKRPIALNKSETNLIKKMREQEAADYRAKEEAKQIELLKKAFKLQQEMDKNKPPKKVDMPLTKEEIMLLESMRHTQKTKGK